MPDLASKWERQRDAHVRAAEASPAARDAVTHAVLALYYELQIQFLRSNESA